MQFGRVYGFVTQRSASERWLTVLLDTGRDIWTLRDEAIPANFAQHDLAWLADQLVQETIGIELSVDGWEVIGEDAGESDRGGESAAIGRSPVWIVGRT